MKSEILSLLRESGDYVSGQELCEHFGVTRAAVWKAINQLKKEGYDIDAVQNRGYRLVSERELYGKNELESRIRTRWAGRNVVFYEITDSTNVQAKRLAEQGAAQGTLVVAEEQTAGRGRRGRDWRSPAGSNIYFTLLLRPEYTTDCASMVTLVMALAVREAVQEICGTDVGIKWPNDVVVGGKKVTGILTEMSLEGMEIQHVVIGVGINVKEQTFPAEIADKATSLEEAAGKSVSRAALLQKIMEHFEVDYEKFLQTKDLSLLKQGYNGALVNLGREVRVLDPAGEYGGTALGINEKGELLVRTADGSVKEVYAGEVSVRGIYGYV